VSPESAAALAGKLQPGVKRTLLWLKHAEATNDPMKARSYAGSAIRELRDLPLSSQPWLLAAAARLTAAYDKPFAWKLLADSVTAFNELYENPVPQRRVYAGAKQANEPRPKDPTAEEVQDWHEFVESSQQVRAFSLLDRAS